MSSLWFEKIDYLNHIYRLTGKSHLKENNLQLFRSCQGKDEASLSSLRIDNDSSLV